MDTRYTHLARKYAHAFINAQQEQLDKDVIANLARLEDFLLTSKAFCIALQVPTNNINNRKKAVSELFGRFDIPSSFTRLSDLLFSQGRIALMAPIIREIRLLSDISLGNEQFDVYTSHELTQDEKDLIEAFLKKSIPTNAVVTYKVDTSLISGVRIQSNNRLWEQSIAKQLRMIEQELYHQGAS